MICALSRAIRLYLFSSHRPRKNDSNQFNSERYHLDSWSFSACYKWLVILFNFKFPLITDLFLGNSVLGTLDAARLPKFLTDNVREIDT